MRCFLNALALLAVAVVPGLGLAVTRERGQSAIGFLALVAAVCAVVAGYWSVAFVVQALCLAFAVVRARRSHG